MIGGLVEKLVGEKPIVMVENTKVVRKGSGILFRDKSYFKFVKGGKKWFKSGDENKQVKYKGDIENGIPNGQGIETFIDGFKYVGEFKDGDKHGQGTEIWSSGEKYVGEFKNGKRNGQGTTTFPDGSKYVGEYKNGQHWNVKVTGPRFVGEYKNGKRHGQGTVYSLFGDGKYVGEFKNGKTWNGTHYYKNGKIKYKYVNGKQIVQ